MGSVGMSGHGAASVSLGPSAVTTSTSGVTAVDVGGVNTCALTTGGGVKCWGDSTYGGIGDGSPAYVNGIFYRPAAVDVSGLSSGVAAISVGDMHVCALLNTGALKCWGGNSRGQIGDGTAGLLNSRLTPVAVSGTVGIRGVIAISAGGAHTCVLMATGGVKCWGENGDGQVGNGRVYVNNNCNYGYAKCEFTPVDVSGLTGVTDTAIAIDTGDNHTCALLSTGGVKCWGANSSGQLGDNTSGTDRLLPANVVTPLTVDTGGPQMLKMNVPIGAADPSVSLAFRRQPPDSVPVAQDGFRLGGFFFSIDAYANGGFLDSLTFQQPVVLTIEYTDADVAGLDEATLGLSYHDDGSGLWAMDGIEVVSRDPAANRIVVAISHLTLFGLVEVGEFSLYFPWVPREGGTPNYLY